MRILVIRAARTRLVRRHTGLHGGSNQPEWRKALASHGRTLHWWAESGLTSSTSSVARSEGPSNNGQAGLHWRHFPTLAVEHQVQGTSGGIRNIVVRVFGVVDNVFAASRLPFQADQLREEAVVIEQVDETGIDSGEQVEIEVGFCFFRRNVADAKSHKL